MGPPGSDPLEHHLPGQGLDPLRRRAAPGDHGRAVFGGVAHYPENGSNFELSVGDVVVLGGVQMQYGPTFLQIIPGDGNQADAVFSFGLTAPLDF